METVQKGKINDRESIQGEGHPPRAEELSLSNKVSFWTGRKLRVTKEAGKQVWQRRKAET